jgi:hypothetical protein
MTFEKEGSSAKKTVIAPHATILPAEVPTQDARTSAHFFFVGSSRVDVVSIRDLREAEQREVVALKCSDIRVVDLRPSDELRTTLLSLMGIPKERIQYMPATFGWLLSKKGCLKKTGLLAEIDENVLRVVKGGWN